jgi:hypothetical protein
MGFCRVFYVLQQKPRALAQGSLYDFFFSERLALPARTSQKAVT